MSFSDPHVKFLTILLIVGILATALSNALTAANNERILNDQKRFVAEQGAETREDVETHANDTKRALMLLQQGEEARNTIIDKFDAHANTTASAAPLVAENNELI